MIELEIQGLSESREGLLIDVGRFVIANGFTLQRQRLVQDPHGILMTMVVRGPWLKKRALVSALNAYERFLSVKVEPYVEGELKPHFAASHKLPPQTVPDAAIGSACACDDVSAGRWVSGTEGGRSARAGRGVGDRRRAGNASKRHRSRSRNSSSFSPIRRDRLRHPHPWRRHRSSS
jgi:hypothetical protein